MTTYEYWLQISFPLPMGSFFSLQMPLLGLVFLLLLLFHWRKWKHGIHSIHPWNPVLRHLVSSPKPNHMRDILFDIISNAKIVHDWHLSRKMNESGVPTVIQSRHIEYYSKSSCSSYHFIGQPIGMVRAVRGVAFHRSYSSKSRGVLIRGSHGRFYSFIVDFDQFLVLMWTRFHSIASHRIYLCLLRCCR